MKKIPKVGPTFYWCVGEMYWTFDRIIHLHTHGLDPEKLELAIIANAPATGLN